MFNLTTGKIKLKPNEKKTVKLPKSKYKIKPIVLLTSNLGNHSYTLEKVTKSFFIVSNNTQKNIVINYVVNKGFINSSTTQVSDFLFIEGNDGTIHIPNFYINNENFDLGTINVNDFFNYTIGEDINYTILNILPEENDEAADFVIEDFTIDENGIINLNNNMIYFNDVVFTIHGEMVRDSSLSSTSNIKLNFAEEIYQTNNTAYINYTSPSTLTSYLQYRISYVAGNSESSAGFFIPTLSENNLENFFIFSTDIALSPTLSLGILSNDIPVYITTNPESPLNNRTIATSDEFSNYDYVLLLEDQKDYCFWYNENDQVWYVSLERFPLDLST